MLQQLILPSTDDIPIGFHFYVDGSKVADHQVGAAVLLLCEFSTGTAYGGHLCCRVEGAAHAFLGEHSALIWALVWAIRCSDWCQQVGLEQSVFFNFYYDATTTGMQAAGRWRTFPLPIMAMSHASSCPHSP